MIDLPEGYIVKRDRAVGFTFHDETGNIVIQHPKDNDSIRRLIWEIYKTREFQKARIRKITKGNCGFRGAFI